MTRSREIIRHCSLTIRAVHRGDFSTADQSLSSARALVQIVEAETGQYRDLYQAGYVQDALKEFAEANCVYALVRGQPLPEPEPLHVTARRLPERPGRHRRRAAKIRA